MPETSSGEDNSRPRSSDSLSRYRGHAEGKPPGGRRIRTERQSGRAPAQSARSLFESENPLPKTPPEAFPRKGAGNVAEDADWRADVPPEGFIKGNKMFRRFPCSRLFGHMGGLQQIVFMEPFAQRIGRPGCAQPGQAAQVEAGSPGRFGVIHAPPGVRVFHQDTEGRALGDIPSPPQFRKGLSAARARRAGAFMLSYHPGSRIRRNCSGNSHRNHFWQYPFQAGFAS